MLGEISGPAETPEKIKYVDKLSIASINERGMDDLTGASYVMDASWQCKAATYLTGLIGFGLTSLTPAASGATAVGALAAHAVRRSCDDEYILDGQLRPAGSVFNFSSPRNNGNTDQGANPGQAETNPNVNQDQPDGDVNSNSGGNGNGDNDDDNDDESKEPDSAPEEQKNTEEKEQNTQQENVDGEGVNDSNPNEFDPYQSDGPNIPRRPPGSVGGRYGDMFNPGEERGFTPGDGGDGHPGNPWDRDERMSTPNDDGDPVDPLTGFGGGSDPSDPDNDGDGGPFDDGLYRPNPEDDYGTGLSSIGVKNFSDVSEMSSTLVFVATMSAEIAMI